MAARKLASEIDRTLKKVSEGVEVFDGIFDKIQSSTNQAQKEKLEQDLKSQIKKLQRLRDQIKTWMQSNDIKDKQPLIENRKLIETQMERFKAIEKEMKTKAFSKEGLSAAAKLDPKEQQKHELCHWITTMVDELSRQVEQTEAEIETLQLAKKKKDVERSQRLDELETLNERRNWHVGRLELILRLLENGNLQVDSVLGTKEDIAYFVESNTEEDFEEDEGIYDELNLQEEEDLFTLNNDDLQSSHGDSVSIADDAPSVPPTPNIAAAPLPRTTPSKQDSLPPSQPPPPTPSTKTSLPTTSESPSTSKTKPPTVAATPAPATASVPAKVRKSTLDSNTPRPTLQQHTSTRSVSGPAPSVPTPRTVIPTSLPPIRYAAAAAAANATTVTPPGLITKSPEVSKAIPPPLPTPVVVPTPEVVSSEPAPTIPTPSITSTSSVQQQELQPAQSSPAMSSASVNGGLTTSSPLGTSTPSSSSPSAGPSPAILHQEAPLTTSSSQPPATAQSQAQPPAPATAGERSGGETLPRLPSSLADLVTSFESAKQKSMKRDTDLGGLNKVLEAGYANVPLGVDAEKPKYYVPRNPFATPAYYPHEPSSQFANPALFAKFDVDTLFYIFYYCQGTYLQYLAAQELKKQSWRFHKQYLTWFQRANEPQQITEEFEQGVYLYFDWEGSWCQRRKSDFRFEYRFLSSD